MIKTILVPLDGSPRSENALPIALDLVRVLNSKLVLVCVAGDETSLDTRFTQGDRNAIAEKYANVTEEDHLLSTNPRMVEHAQRQVRAITAAEEYLSIVATRLATEGIRVETAVPFGGAVEGILTEIELHTADLIVMATETKSALGGIFEKSVAFALLTRSPIPILVIPPERE